MAGEKIELPRVEEKDGWVMGWGVLDDDGNWKFVPSNATREPKSVEALLEVIAAGVQELVGELHRAREVSARMQKAWADAAEATRSIVEKFDRHAG